MSSWLDPTKYRGGPEFPGLDGSKPEGQNGTNQRTSVISQKRLEEARELIETTTLRSVSSLPITPVVSPTVEDVSLRVARAAVGEAPTQPEAEEREKPEVQGANTDPIAEETEGDGEDDSDFFGGIGENFEGVSVQGGQSTVVNQGDATAWEPERTTGERFEGNLGRAQLQALEELENAVNSGRTISNFSIKNGKVEENLPNKQDINGGIFALYNEKTRTVTYSGYNEKKIEVFKQDQRLKDCRFIEILPENLAAFRPLLLKIINTNTANMSKQETREKTERSHSPESRHVEHSNREGINQKTESSPSKTVGGANKVSDRRDPNQLKKEIVDAEIRRTEEKHLKEALQIKNEQQAADRKQIIEKKEIKRELDEERINKGKT